MESDESSSSGDSSKDLQRTGSNTYLQDYYDSSSDIPPIYVPCQRRPQSNATCSIPHNFEQGGTSSSSESNGNTLQRSGPHVTSDVEPQNRTSERIWGQNQSKRDRVQPQSTAPKEDYLRQTSSATVFDLINGDPRSLSMGIGQMESPTANPRSVGSNQDPAGLGFRNLIHAQNREIIPEYKSSVNDEFVFTIKRKTRISLSILGNLLCMAQGYSVGYVNSTLFALVPMSDHDQCNTTDHKGKTNWGCLTLMRADRIILQCTLSVGYCLSTALLVFCKGQSRRHFALIGSLISFIVAATLCLTHEIVVTSWLRVILGISGGLAVNSTMSYISEMSFGAPTSARNALSLWWPLAWHCGVFLSYLLGFIATIGIWNAQSTGESNERRAAWTAMHGIPQVLIFGAVLCIFSYLVKYESPVQYIRQGDAENAMSQLYNIHEVRDSNPAVYELGIMQNDMIADKVTSAADTRKAILLGLSDPSAVHIMMVGSCTYLLWRNSFSLEEASAFSLIIAGVWLLGSITQKLYRPTRHWRMCTSLVLTTISVTGCICKGCDVKWLYVVMWLRDLNKTYIFLFLLGLAMAYALGYRAIVWPFKGASSYPIMSHRALQWQHAVTWLVSVIWTALCGFANMHLIFLAMSGKPPVI